MWRTAGTESAAPALMTINASGTPMITQTIRRRMCKLPSLTLHIALASQGAERELSTRRPVLKASLGRLRSLALSRRILLSDLGWPGAAPRQRLVQELLDLPLP